MRITWSIPVRGEGIESSRGDLVRARFLIEALRNDGHDVRIVQDITRKGSRFTISSYRKLLRHVLPGSLALILRDTFRYLHARGHGREVAREARKQGADLIVETQVNFAGSGMIAANLTGLPFILDDCSPSYEQEVRGSGIQRFANFILRKQSDVATALVTSSKELSRKLEQEGIPGEKLRVIPNGIEKKLNNFGKRDFIRRKYGIDDRVVLCFVGSFQPWHQTELLIEALNRIKNSYAVHLFLIGNGPGLKSSLALSHELRVDDLITSFGSVEPQKVKELAWVCDIGILPGTNDYGHPMKLLEYSSVCLPVVAPDLSPVREIVEHGVNGLLFLPGDIGSLTESIICLVNDKGLRDKLGKKGYDKIQSSDLWSSRARKLISLVERQQMSKIRSGGN